MSMVSGKTVDIQKMLRSKPADEEFDAVRRIFRRKARQRNKSSKNANNKDLITMVTQNHSLYKQVLQQKIMCEEINKAKSLVAVDESHKIKQSYTFAISPRFDANAMTIRY